MAGGLKPTAKIAFCAAIGLVAAGPAYAQTVNNVSRSAFYTADLFLGTEQSSSNDKRISKGSGGLATLSKSGSLTNFSSGSSFELFAKAAPGKLGVSLKGTSAAGQPDTNTFLNVHVNARMDDTWTFTSDNPAMNDGKHHVIVHSKLKLNGTMDSTAKGLQQFPPRDNFVDATTSVSLVVNGSGISLPTSGLVGFSGSNVDSHNDPIPPPNMTPLTEIDAALDLIVGVETPIFLSMTEVGNAQVLDKDFKTFTPGLASFSGDFSHTLEWAPGLFVTDENGVVLNDLTMTSGSGFDYMHPDFGGAVPEPATWALLIGGFGLVGGVMRRARGKGALLAA